MNDIVHLLNAYIQAHPFDSGDSNCKTVLDQLYHAHTEYHDFNPPEIYNGFMGPESYLETLSLDDNNAIFNLCCRLCAAYEHKGFLDELQYGAHLILDFMNR